jgi:YfiH family protein
VHGADVVVVTEPGEHAGAEADAAVTAVPGCTLVVRTADCAPVVLTSANVVAVAHAGWRGVMAGVLENTVAAMRRLDPSSAITAVVGPHIGPECYEFGGDDLDTVAARCGDAVRGVTREGTPALDLGAAVAAALAAQDVAAADDYPCTACEADRYYSWRARRETARFATSVAL